MKDTTEIIEGLQKQAAKQVNEPKSLSEMEGQIRKLMRVIGRLLLQVWLIWEENKIAKEELRCSCGESLSKQRRKATIRSLFGPIRYERDYGYCPDCQQGVCPLDEKLGLRPNAMSAELERLAGMVGVERPFEQGSRLFEALTLQPLSDQSVDKAAQAYGEEQIRQEENWHQEAYDMDNLLKLKREAKRPRRMYGAIDGGRVHVREQHEQDNGWRELKVGAWFTTKAQPPKKRGDEWSIRADNISYYCDIIEAEQFAHLVWASAVQRRAHLAHELIILGDGAHWIWDIVDEHFPDAIQIVDWYHACQYLHPVAQLAFKDKSKRECWLEKVTGLLWTGDLDAVIAACAEHIQPTLEDDPAQKAVTYYTNNRQRMDYPTYRANGYHIGSGTIESGVKQIASQRMKVSGAIWNLEPARKVSKARAAYLSGQWDSLAARRTRFATAA